MNRKFHNLRESSTHAGYQHPRWRIVFIALVLALAIGSAGQTQLAQAQDDDAEYYYHLWANPVIYRVCKDETKEISIRILVTGSVGPNQRFEDAAITLGRGTTITGDVQDASIADFTAARTQLINSPSPSLIRPALVVFTVKGKEKGETTINFTGSVVEFGRTIRAKPVEVIVEVEICTEVVTTIGEWQIPGPANISIVAISDDAEVKADEQGTYTGSTVVNWVLTSGQVLDCIPQSVTTSSQLDWTGQKDDNGQLTLDGIYKSAAMSLPVYCVGSEGGVASGSTPIQLTADPVQVSTLSEGGVFKQPQVLEGPEGPISGSVTIIVVPEEGQAVSFIPWDYHVSWDDFSSLFGVLLALP